jgi:membrane associated rhomboid family serine protease
VVTLIRVTRLALLLVLAVIAVSLLIALFRPETGGYEKAALAALVAACFGMGIAVTFAARHLRRLALSRQSAPQR